MTTDGVRLGDLLTGAGLLQASDLREAMMISKQQGLPVGRVLIMSGYLTEQHLQAAVQAQSLLKDGLIDFDLVIKALTMVGSEEITLEEAFKRLKWNQQSDAVTNKLGELLLAADIVPVDALNAALLQCQSIGLPLGRVLIGNGNLTEQMLAATLNAQVFIRDKKLTREQAIQGLRSAKERQIPIEQYLAETGALSLPTAETVRLGELFVMAGLVDEPALMSAVEVGLLNEQPVGQVLLQTNLISQEILDAALDLQAMVGAGAIKKDEAAKFLATVKHKNVSVGEAIAIGHQKPSKKKASAAAAEEPPIPAIEPLHLYQFLQLSGIITAKQIEEAIRAGSKNTAIMANMLRLSGVMNSELVDAAEKCNDLICSGVLNHEQGMIVLKNCERNNFTLEQAFNELGWNTAPLRADPGVPEALLDTPKPSMNEAVTDTTAQLSEAKFGESALSASTAEGKPPEGFEATAASLPAAEPRQHDPAEATSPTLTPLGAPATLGAGTWSAPEASTPFEAPAQANPFDSQPQLNPLDAPPAAASALPTDQTPAAKAEADALAEFGSSINQPQPQFAAGQPTSAAASSAPVDAAQADPFGNSAGAWHSPSPDEWMPRSAETAAQPDAAQSAPQAPAQQPQPVSDPWQAGGQAQMTADSWHGGQAQQNAPAESQAPAPAAASAAPSSGVPSASSDWQSTKVSQDWAQTAAPQAPATPPQAAPTSAPQTPAAPQPAQEWNPAAGANDWGAPQAPSQPAPTANDWAAAQPQPLPPQTQPAQAPGGATDWGAPEQVPQSEWVPANNAAPAQPDWGTSTAPAASAASDWGAPPQPQQPQAQPAQPPAQQPAAQAAPQQADWASSSSSSMPGMQPDWAAGQSAPATSAATTAAAPSEWQPPTSSAPQESAWGAPPDAQQQPAPAPTAPTQPAQPSWQSAAPSPLPGWQSTSTTNQDAWQPMPNSPAAQMFQEAAQSLQGTPPADNQHPPADANQGPMDLFSDGDEEHPDQQDKPKKRLSDLMPKFGQKS